MHSIRLVTRLTLDRVGVLSYIIHEMDYESIFLYSNWLTLIIIEIQGGDTLLYRVQLSSSTGQNKVNGQLGIFSIVNGQATKFL